MAKLDLRKTLRAIAVSIQDENVDRLLQGLVISGGSVAPRVTTVATAKGRQKRIRLFGIRVNLRDLSGKVGVQSGAMLQDAQRRGNIKVGRASFKIIPSPAMRARWFPFMKGSKHQVARPVSGITDTRIAAAREQIARDAREQFVRMANQRERG